MSSAPFAALKQPIPVRIVEGGAALTSPSDEVALIRIDRSPHDHADGHACVACDSRGNIRVLLFELLERVRRGGMPMPREVVVDATLAADPAALREALVPGRLPAQGLRDFTVARSFRLMS
jgi:hypothetical protein